MAKLSGIDRRKARVRRAIKARAGGRPRLSVFRSDKNIYAQIIDDANGRTLAAASSQVGKVLAERATKAGIGEVVFDRGAYIYHGRVKALADAAREGGLSF
jgi:large subunit ribosomal protein L18